MLLEVITEQLADMFFTFYKTLTCMFTSIIRKINTDIFNIIKFKELFIDSPKKALFLNLLGAFTKWYLYAKFLFVTSSIGL